MARGTDSLVVDGKNNGINDIADAYTAIVGGNGNNTWSGSGGFIGAGFANSLGGFENAAQPYASSIVGGSSNSVFGAYASIGGGLSNAVFGTGSAIVGGELNYAQARQDVIGGGYANHITVTPDGGPDGAALSVIGGGSYNVIASTTPGAAASVVIGGGSRNTAVGTDATIAGGYANSASGIGASVPGGSNNRAAGADSFAAGTNAFAKNDGSFVFSDDAPGAKSLVTSASDEFLVRASGGVAFYSAPGLTAGVVLRAGSGSWSSLSDRASKTRIVALDPSLVLAKVAALPISEWSYRSQDGNIRHIGPMAQDFYAAFRIGEDDRHITTIDEDGVALAAIKGLAAELQRKNHEIADLRAAIGQLSARDEQLEAKVTALLARVP